LDCGEKQSGKTVVFGMDCEFQKECGWIYLTYFATLAKTIGK
jgi:hypothetical protein